MMYKGSYLLFRLYHGVSLFVFAVGDLKMSSKPTYEELEKRIQELEQAKSELKWAEETLRETKKHYQRLV